MKETKKQPIKICALTLYPFNTVPGQRFRIEQWEPYLLEDGISLDYFSFADEKLVSVLPREGKFAEKVWRLSKAFVQRVFTLRVLFNYDAIYLFRGAAMVGPAILERLMKLTGRPIVFDFDDAIFLSHTANANRFFGWLKFAGKTSSICRLSSAVTVGNTWLSEWSRQHNENTFVVPTGIDTDAYQPLDRAENKKLIVGWAGSSTSQYHLELFEPTLVKLLERHDVEIHVISNREPSFKSIPYTWREWSPETEVREIGQFDIGIMPNPDDEWSKGKCALKALQYMSMAVPTICTDIGANREVIQNGENGLLAKSEEEWLTELERLILDPALRKQIGSAARQTVVEKYSMKKCAELFKNVIIDSLNTTNNRKEK